MQQLVRINVPVIQKSEQPKLLRKLILIILFTAMESPLVKCGQAGEVHYLEGVENWDVFVSCSLGQSVGFNRLMLASVSSLFKRVLLDLGEESDNGGAHISTNFATDELKHLHELCHYGAVKHGQASLFGTKSEMCVIFWALLFCGKQQLYSQNPMPALPNFEKKCSFKNSIFGYAMQPMIWTWKV